MQSLYWPYKIDSYHNIIIGHRIHTFAVVQRFEINFIEPWVYFIVLCTFPYALLALQNFLLTALCKIL